MTRFVGSPPVPVPGVPAIAASGGGNGAGQRPVRPPEVTKAEYEPTYSDPPPRRTTRPCAIAFLLPPANELDYHGG